MPEMLLSRRANLKEELLDSLVKLFQQSLEREGNLFVPGLFVSYREEGASHVRVISYNLSATQVCQL